MFRVFEVLTYTLFGVQMIIYLSSEINIIRERDSRAYNKKQFRVQPQVPCNRECRRMYRQSSPNISAACTSRSLRCAHAHRSPVGYCPASNLCCKITRVRINISVSRSGSKKKPHVKESFCGLLAE